MLGIGFVMVNVYWYVYEWLNFMDWKWLIGCMFDEILIFDCDRYGYYMFCIYVCDNYYIKFEVKCVEEVKE